LSHCPDLARFFVWAYAESSELRLSSGEIVGKSATGCRQGDPLASLFFCVGFQSLLAEIDKVVKSSVAYIEGDGAFTAGVVAYMDDCSVFAPESCINGVAAQLNRVFSSYRLTLATRKCRFLGAKAREIVSPYFRVEEEGEIIMGCPTGNEQYRLNTVKQMVADMELPLNAIDLISTGAAFNILRSCINSRPVYLSRVLEMEFTQECLLKFDSAIDIALLSLSGATPLGPRTDALVSVVERAVKVRTLPTKLGGLGVARHVGINSEKNIMLSRGLTTIFIAEFLPSVESGTLSWHPIQLGRGSYFERPRGQSHGTRDPIEDNISDSSSEEISLEGKDFNSLDSDEIHKRVQLFHEGTRSLLHNQMNLLGECASAAWFLSSSFKASGRWLSNKGAVHFGKYGFQAPDFAEALRLRLLLPPVMDDTQLHQWVCPCGTTELIKLPFHLLYCPQSKSYQIRRHDLIVDLL
jgi:hypothetical protein